MHMRTPPHNLIAGLRRLLKSKPDLAILVNLNICRKLQDCRVA